MLKVKTILKESPGKGIGLFAVEFIPGGTVCWQHDAQFDRVVQPWVIAQSTDQELQFLETYGCKLADGSRHICLDNARFINHADNGNVMDGENASGFYFRAVRDIQPGDEILTNYNEICADCKQGLGFVPR